MADQITVFAAASLKTALDDLTPRFTDQTGHDVTYSFAGSSALARQIELGAPADIFISANPGWVDYLEAAGTIDAATRVDILSNRLVIIEHGQAVPGRAHPVDELALWLGDDRLAMALVDAVPAGIYGKAALQSLGAWDTVQPQVVQTDNVRAALALVALGEARYGIVYATDARADRRVNIAATIPKDTHPPIRYPAAAITGRNTRAVTALLDYLRSPGAGVVFRRHGFIPVGDSQ